MFNFGVLFSFKSDIKKTLLLGNAYFAFPPEMPFSLALFWNMIKGGQTNENPFDFTKITTKIKYVLH